MMIKLHGQTKMIFNTVPNHFCCRTLGRLNHLIVFSFQGFEIGRHLLATVKDPQEMTLMPTAPYDRSRRRGKYDRAVKVLSQCEDKSWVIPGERPTRLVY